MPAQKKTIGLREVRVGLFVVIALAILILLILNASGDISPFSSKLHLRARFANADGIRSGSEVRLAGVSVGTVDDVRLLPPRTIRRPCKSKLDLRLTAPLMAGMPPNVFVLTPLRSSAPLVYLAMKS